MYLDDLEKFAYRRWRNRFASFFLLNMKELVRTWLYVNESQIEKKSHGDRKQTGGNIVRKKW